MAEKEKEFYSSPERRLQTGSEQKVCHRDVAQNMSENPQSHGLTSLFEVKQLQSFNLWHAHQEEGADGYSANKW